VLQLLRVTRELLRVTCYDCGIYFYLFFYFYWKLPIRDLARTMRRYASRAIRRACGQGAVLSLCTNFVWFGLVLVRVGLGWDSGWV
jgi:hypothetical protein